MYTSQKGFYMTGNWKAAGLCTETADKFSTARIASKMQTLKFSMFVYRGICIQGKKCYTSTNMDQILWPNVLIGTLLCFSRTLPWTFVKHYWNLLLTQTLHVSYQGMVLLHWLTVQSICSLLLAGSVLILLSAIVPHALTLLLSPKQVEGKV